MRSSISPFLFLFFTLFFVVQTEAQNKATVYGTIKDSETKNAIEFATISLSGEAGGVNTDKDGKYELIVPAGKEITIVISHLSYGNTFIKMKLAAGEKKEISPNIKINSISFTQVEIEDIQGRRGTMRRIDPKLISVFPTAGSGVEALLKTLPGVVSNNELSSQYSVRGGNYDENLIYVNDIEVYRPFLVRSGQQEGLSFINSDMVSSILFSSGGFDARYGDKMSSVLDVQYRKPREFGGTVTGSVLGGALHLEGISKSARLTYQLGLRQRSNKYILSALDTKGEYKPSFVDGQFFVTYDFTPEFEINILGNYARNKYQLIPENRETDFGTVNEALRLKVYFDGKEVDDYETYTGAISAIYRPNKDLKLKFITSAYQSKEFETYDIQGQYYIYQLENDFAKDNFGDIKFSRGVGTFFNHARDYLTATVYNAEHKGYYKDWRWGTKYQHEQINDQLSEWKMVDSAGYSLPLNPSSSIDLQDVVKQKISIGSNRFTSYLQNTWSWGNSKDYSLTAGVRTNYWDLNNQFLVSPRATFSIKPNWKKDFLFRASSGYYYQPPFYRELRDFQGNINYNLKAQTSIHFVLGSDYNFKAWNRPFKFVSELYYKHLDNLVPYEIDNVRIRYYAKNNARGYATGIDMKVNGEFVNGIESWFSLSVMQTKEDLKDDFYYQYLNSDGVVIIPGYTTNNVKTDSVRKEPGYIPRPTDQRVNVGIFFQDYIPRLPAFKMHLNFLLGTGMPFGPPSFQRYKDTLRMPPYRRVDIGFSYQIKSEEKELKKKNPLHYIKSMWISLEVFNLLQVNNTISYLWIKDVTNREYAIPNYLTARQLNLKLITKF